ncbi:MAG: hypothetical protein J6Y92_12125 [Lentisphaeria bacterium]|nr:hypothetical protein [Lentisphaeria bacterium]
MTHTATTLQIRVFHCVVLPFLADFRCIPAPCGIIFVVNNIASNRDKNNLEAPGILSFLSNANPTLEKIRSPSVTRGLFALERTIRLRPDSEYPREEPDVGLNSSCPVCGFVFREFKTKEHPRIAMRVIWGKFRFRIADRSRQDRGVAGFSKRYVTFSLTKKRKKARAKAETDSESV